MFGGGYFGQCIGVFTHCLCRLHLHSCSYCSTLLHLRPLSRPEPPSVLCLPWFCFTPWVCVHESWRIELKEEGRKMQFDVWVPKVTKTSVRWQKFTLQGFQFRHFYQWTEMKNKVLSLLQDSNWSLCRSLLIRQCLKIPNLTELSQAPCSMHIQHSMFSLSFAELCAFLLQLISGNNLLQKSVPNENDKHPLAERQVCYWVPKLD